jgi:hypothetical protein
MQISIFGSLKIFLNTKGTVHINRAFQKLLSWSQTEVQCDLHFVLQANPPFICKLNFCHEKTFTHLAACHFYSGKLDDR